MLNVHKLAIVAGALFLLESIPNVLADITEGSILTEIKISREALNGTLSNDSAELTSSGTTHGHRVGMLGVPGATHSHYEADIGRQCEWNEEGIVKTPGEDGGDIRCGELPESMIDELIAVANINLHRGPFCSCVQSSADYCAMKIPAIIKVGHDSLVIDGIDFNVCFACFPPFCNITEEMQSGSCNGAPVATTGGAPSVPQSSGKSRH